jgi:hypothetical protein
MYKGYGLDCLEKVRQKITEECGLEVVQHRSFTSKIGAAAS